MTATWILVLLFIGAITARFLRSTKMWWILLSTIMAGLLVGMLSKEAVNHFSKNDDIASITQLISTVDNMNMECTLPVVFVTETTSQSGVTSYIACSDELLSDALVGNHTTKGRDSPDYEDDS